MLLATLFGITYRVVKRCDFINDFIRIIKIDLGSFFQWFEIRNEDKVIGVVIIYPMVRTVVNFGGSMLHIIGRSSEIKTLAE